MKKLILLGVITMMVAGCATDNDMGAQSLSSIYDTAYAELNEENYEEAAAEFIRAETEYPSSEWAAKSLVMAAYSQYMDGDFPGALLTINRFMRFHPGHSEVAYMMYLRGMCYYRQVSDVRRESGMSINALKQFEQLVARFPKSEYAENAENKINILKNYIAGKIMYSARQDASKENWTSAIRHFQFIITEGDRTVMVPEALYRLTECYTALGLTEQADGYAEMLKLNFPDNEWTKKLD